MTPPGSAEAMAETYRQRFTRYGGIARTNFYRGSDAQLEADINKAIKSCNLDLLFRTIEFGLDERLGSMQAEPLVEYRLKLNADGSVSYCSTSMDFVSADIRERVMKEKEVLERARKRPRNSLR